MNFSRIKLRALTMGDLPQTLAWRNQDDIMDLYASHPFPINQEMEQKWYDRILTSNIPVTPFGVEIAESKKLIGITILHGIDLINRSAGLAILIGDNNERGKGYSREALFLTLEFGFMRLGLHRIWLKVRSDNTVAYNLYKRIGFHEEGLLRDDVFKNGSYKDMAVLSILDSEFAESFY